MPYAIIAGWDAQMGVSRYNYVEAETEAQRLVERLQGLEPSVGRKAEMRTLLDDPKTSLGKRTWAEKEMAPLPLAKQAPNAYYVLMPPAPAGTALFQHRARFWIADPANSTVSFDTTACHAWQSKITSRAIDAEADARTDRVLSPDDPARAGRVRSEMPEGPGRAAQTNRVKALRTAAQALKDTLAAKTPEEVLAVHSDDDGHWPE